MGEAILNQLIYEVIEKEHPENVEELAEIVYAREKEFSKSTIIKYVKKLEEEGKITLIGEFVPKKVLWLWIVIGLTLVTNISVFMISEQSVLVPVRWVIGYLFCFFIPGFCSVKVLFPNKELDVIETVLLSVGLSLAILPIVGLLVNFVMGSIALPFILFSLSLLVLTLALTAYLKHGKEN